MSKYIDLYIESLALFKPKTNKNNTEKKENFDYEEYINKAVSELEKFLNKNPKLKNKYKNLFQKRKLKKEALVKKRVKVVRKIPNYKIYYRQQNVRVDDENLKKIFKKSFDIDELNKKIENDVNNIFENLKKYYNNEKLKSLFSDTENIKYQLEQNDNKAKTLKNLIANIAGFKFDNLNDVHIFFKDKNTLIVDLDNDLYESRRVIKFDKDKIFVENSFLNTLSFDVKNLNTAENFLLRQLTTLEKLKTLLNKNYEVKATASTNIQYIGAGIQPYKGYNIDTDLNTIKRELIASFYSSIVKDAEDLDLFEIFTDALVNVNNYDDFLSIEYTDKKLINKFIDYIKTHKLLDTEPRLKKIFTYIMKKIDKNNKITMRDILKIINIGFDVKINSKNKFIENQKKQNS